MTIGTDMAHRIVHPRWRRGARIRAVKRYTSKAVRAIREFRDDLVSLAAIMRPVPADPAMRGVILRALCDGETGGATVIRDGLAFEQRRGPHFHDTVRA